jgi:hypothetical protein
MPKKTDVVPTYMKGKQPMRIAVVDIVKIIKMIDDHNQIEKFQNAAKRQKAFVSVDAETVNFVKDYMVKSNLHNDPVGLHIVNARGARATTAARTARTTAARDRFDCDFGRR